MKHTNDTQSCFTHNNTDCAYQIISGFAWLSSFTGATATPCLPTSTETCNGQRTATLGRQLQSSSNKLVFPRTRLKTVGDGAFGAPAACTRNDLPPSVTNVSSISAFRKHLKTYLFNQQTHCCTVYRVPVAALTTL